MSVVVKIKRPIAPLITAMEFVTVWDVVIRLYPKKTEKIFVVLMDKNLIVPHIMQTVYV